MKFQYLSDIHLEVKRRLLHVNQVPGANNLFLLGDICRLDNQLYITFINECAKTWKNVFVIYGNHE